MTDKRAPFDAISAVISATRALDEGDLASAERDARSALGSGPLNAQAHFILGEVARLRGEPAAAERHYRRAIQGDEQVPYFHHALGNALQDAGRLADAIAAYQRAVRLSPTFAEAWNDLGTAQFASGRAAEAVACYRRALTHAPRHGVAQENLGAALRSMGDLRGALRALGRQLLNRLRPRYRHGAKPDPASPAGWLQRGNRAMAGALAERVLSERADDADALSVKGRIALDAERKRARLLADAGQPGEALRVLERLAREDGDDANWSADALALLARLRVLQRDSANALEPAERALAKDGECTEAAYWRARALVALGWYGEAEESLREWAPRRPGDPRWPRWLGIALRAGEKLEEAEATLRAALQAFPDDFDLQSELLITLFERGDVDAARARLADLQERHPRHAGAIAAMSAVLYSEGDIQGAVEHARRAIAMEPDHAVAHHNLALALLKAGRFEEGWPEHEWRKRLHDDALTHARFDLPGWEAQPLAGRTLLVYAEQGLGDEIMFASCLPDVLRAAGHVIVECDPRLGALFGRSFPNATVLGRKRERDNRWLEALPRKPDLQVAIGSLPLRYRRRKEDFPAHGGYLSADPEKVARWRSWLDTLGPGRKIGLSWRGGLAKTGRVRRSVDLPALASVLKTPGFRFVSLQYGPVADDLARLERQHGMRVEHRQDAIDDYDETAALMSALDGVLSVCTAVVHLAGALGRRVLVLAPYSAEWRYGMSGETLPWYPSATVLRQPEPGAWPAVLAEAAARLDSKFAPESMK